MKYSRIEWWYVHAWMGLLQAILGAPLWYQVYVVGESVDAIALRLTTGLEALPSPVVAGVVITMVLSLFGPVVAAGIGFEELRRRGGDPGWSWIALTLIGLQLWPLQLPAVWLHRRDAVECPDLDDREWRFEVSEA